MKTEIAKLEDFPLHPIPLPRVIRILSEPTWSRMVLHKQSNVTTQGLRLKALTQTTLNVGSRMIATLKPSVFSLFT